MCGPEANRESLFLLWRVCPGSCWRSREGVKWEKDLSNRPAFGDNSQQGLSLTLEDPPSPSDQGLNQDGIHQSCPEQGTEAHSAGTLKLTDEDPDCGGVDMLREQTGIGKHPGTSMLKSLYHWGLSNSISKGKWEPELCRGSIHRSWGLGESSLCQDRGQERTEEEITQSSLLLYSDLLQLLANGHAELEVRGQGSPGAAILRDLSTPYVGIQKSRKSGDGQWMRLRVGKWRITWLFILDS